MGSEATVTTVGAADATGKGHRAASQGGAAGIATTDPVLCPYCRTPARLLTAQDSDYVYPRGNYGPVWACLPCQAWVTCHKGTHAPTGRLADFELRTWKIKAHRAFDPLWKDARQAYPELTSIVQIGRIARTRAYLWLAHQLGIAPEECHIGYFDVHRCKCVVEIIQTHRVNPAMIRAWAKDCNGLRNDRRPTP